MRVCFRSCLFVTLLCALLIVMGCSQDETPSPADDNPAPSVAADPLADAPADLPAFLRWAGEKLETEPAPVPIPTSPTLPQPHWTLLRLDDAKMVATAQKACTWQAPTLAGATSVEIGPYRSDRPGPMFSPQRAPETSPAGEESLALTISGFEVRGEDVGSIEMTLSVPYGKHVTLSWSRLGSIIVPVESHEEAFTVRVLTDGFVEWEGPRDKITILTDGLGKGIVEIHSLRFVAREHPYSQPTGRQRVRLGREIRTAIYAHCPAKVTYGNMLLPDDAMLQVGLGHVVPASPEAGAQTPARTRFEVIITDQGEQTTVLDREVAASNVWRDASASLARWGGKSVELTLKCTSTAREAVALWGNPIVYEPVGDPPMLVMYMIDTVASEHLGLYGYRRQTMPRLAALAEHGVWFVQMFSNSSRTIESIPDLMLSMPVERHGVYHSSTGAPIGLVTLAEALRATGFATASFCTNVNAGPRQRMDQGFDTFVDRISFKHEDVDRTIPLQEVMAWINAYRDRPMFLYIHTAEPHSPYTPPPGFRDRFDPDYTGPFAGVRFYKASDPRDLAHLQALYDEEIVYADARLGLFVDTLQEQGLFENAHFFVTSDHGEEFLQHGQWEHGRDLHNELTRIPLVAFGPRFTARGKVDTPVQLLDVMPTILDMFDLPAPYPLHGTSLLPFLANPGGATDARPTDYLRRRSICASNHKYRIEFDRLEYSIIKNGRWKLVFGVAEVPMYRGGSKSRFTLFDLQADPRERRNLLHARPNVARRLAEELVRWRLDQHPYDPGMRGPTVIDAEQMRDLEALGYVGGDSSADDPDD